MQEKKSLIDQVMLGLFLFAALIVLGATVADDIKAKNEITKLRTIIQNAALSSAKYYVNEDDSTNDAELNANRIVSKSNLGQSIQGDLTYTWDFVTEPNNVKVKLANHTVDYFWYKFIDLTATDPFDIEARADIINTGSDDPRCVCGEEPGVSLKDRILCIIGTQSREQVQVSEDSIRWKVKSVFDESTWEEEEWYNQSDVDEVFVVTFAGDDQIQLSDLSIMSTIDAGCGDDQIQGGLGPDTIYGNEGDDQIEGNDGKDILYGGNGVDQIQGGNGDDTLYIQPTIDDSIDGGSGNNIINLGIGYSDDCEGTVVFECTGDSVILVY